MEPVLVGVGRLTDRSRLFASLADLITGAVLEAVKDAVQGAPTTAQELLQSVTTIACPGTFTQDLEQVLNVEPTYVNLPATVAMRAGCSRVTRDQCFVTSTKGSAPQFLINKFCDEIAQGSEKVVVVCGGESLTTTEVPWLKGNKTAAIEQLTKWRHDAGMGSPITLPVCGLTRPMVSSLESKYGVGTPVGLYAMIEQAFRRHLNHSVSEHAAFMGDHLSLLSAVACQPENAPHSWISQQFTSREISDPNVPGNRFVAFPHTKRMTAYHLVEQSAAVLLMSRARALAMGLDPRRFVYLHGGANAAQGNFTLNRPVLHESAAMEAALTLALAAARVGFEQVEWVDFYTCFPCVPAMAWRAMTNEGPRPKREGSLIGGLMYHGGPGANTATHSLVNAVHKLRANPDSYALVHANGGIMCTHSVGVYSCQPPSRPWATPSAVEVTPAPVNLTDEEGGVGSVETYTVLFDRTNQPTDIIVVGRLGQGAATEKRFIAKMQVTPKSIALAMTGALDRATGMVEVRHGMAWFTADHKAQL